ncbi:MAG: DUF1015 domain-containing protein [Candidatus Hinthialibacter antarcticus]|nr:DUF1015 domain-containing protein [Candidatus Hinthialibacter antarcticus]
MADIHPFPGLRFNLDRVPQIDKLISPPYDKIPHEERKRLWGLDEHNVVKLILPQPGDEEVDVTTHSTDSESADWYQEAAARFQAWQDEGVLKQDGPQFYVYSQTYQAEEQTWTRTGLFAALDLEDDSGPKAHEQTFEGPKADRLRLTRAAQANLSSIFLLGDGEAATWSSIFASAKDVLLDFVGDDGQRHMLRAISNPDDLAAVQAGVKACNLVIADGHHRYETACNYRREMMEKTGKNSKDEAWGKVLAFIVPLADPGLRVLPTHRVVKGLPTDWFDRVQAKLDPLGAMTPVSISDGAEVRDLLAADASRSSVLIHDGHYTWAYRIRQGAESPSLQAAPESIRELNVTILHRLIFEEALGLTNDKLVNHVKYIRGEDEAMNLAKTPEYNVAFLMAGIPPAQVFDVSMAGVRMPQKSTDFYPKIPTGLLIRSAADSNA